MIFRIFTVFLVAEASSQCSENKLKSFTLNYQTSPNEYNYVMTRFPDERTYQSPSTSNVFSSCFWIFPFYINRISTLMSYAHEDEDNIINFALNDKMCLLHSKLLTDASYTFYHFESFRWTHICFVIDSNSSEVFINGKSKNKTEIVTEAIPLQGYLVLGQDQDTILGGFSSWQMFIGKITEPHIWLSKIDSTIVKDEFLGISDSTYTDNLVDFKWTAVNNVTIEEISQCEVRERSHVVVIPHLLAFNDAVNFCHMMGMKIAAPTSIEEQNSIRLRSNRDDCIGQFYSQNCAWIGYRRNITDQHWYTVYGQKIDFINENIYASLSSEFNNFIIQENQGLSAILDWEKYCFLCDMQEISISRINLQGLCSDIITLTINIDENGWLTFVSNINIHISKRDDIWNIKFLPSNSIIATLDSSLFPLGRKMWLIKDFDCQRLPNDLGLSNSLYKDEELVLSTCLDDEFTCDDGSCVSMDKRCSKIYDCKDLKDESNCYNVDISPQNRNRRPPMDPLHIDVFTYISKFSHINIKDQYLQLDIQVQLKWIDIQPTFLNLKKLTILDDEYENKLWIPKLQIRNSYNLLSKSFLTTVFVIRNSTPIRRNNDYIYEGGKNSLVANIRISKRINCNFDLVWYPFDTQLCTAYFRITNSRSESTIMTARSEPFVRKATIVSSGGQTEYIVSHVKMVADYNKFNVSFELHRQISYHIFSTYLPILLLHGIGYGTMFIRFDNFQDRGTMSLTTLLVLISLYTDTMTSLPATSYVKLIDVWFIFSVIFLSSIIAVHLITNDVITRVDKFNNKLPWYKNKQLIYSKFRLVLGVIYLIFIMCYFSKMIHLSYF